jgi:hypothetical protein
MRTATKAVIKLLGRTDRKTRIFHYERGTNPYSLRHLFSAGRIYPPRQQCQRGRVNPE